jgi:glutathione S-transferase
LEKAKAGLLAAGDVAEALERRIRRLTERSTAPIVAAMPLKLYMHPFASFCQKVLVALYENATPFEPHLVDLGDETSRAAFVKIWPVGRFPVLRDEEKDRTIPESTIIIEYLAHNYPGPLELVPRDANLALETRLWDRFFDLYVDEPMQKIVVDRLRPPGKSDAHGVEHAKTLLKTAYGIIDERMATRAWATGSQFGMADCAAAPALFYANLVQPFDKTYPNVAAYAKRLDERPSFARVVREAEPYFKNFPR